MPYVFYSFTKMFVMKLAAKGNMLQVSCCIFRYWHLQSMPQVS